MPARAKRAPTLAPTIAAHRIQRKRLSDLLPAAYNPRRISKSARAGLESSLKRFGYVDLIVWNERSGTVVGGHQRLDVLRADGVLEVDVVVVDLPEPDEKALNVALNNPHISGEFNDQLDALLEEIRQADEMLFAELRLDQLLEEAARKRPGLTDPDHVPPAPKTPITRCGDLYEMGAHRLLCGDSTIAADVAALLGILDFPRPSKSELHPTMKPVELLEQLLTDGSAPGSIVYDPFTGSGSTLIACELQSRRCRAIELDPLYCDVIVARWEAFTGKTATRHRTPD